MYECLLQFAAAKRVDATKNLPDTQANQWVWDGNVPTNATTPDGQKLGRWVNNQRTAKQKSKLRPDREGKLIATGLKWFVIPPDAWDDMFAELNLYIAAKTADGSPWDGNVPTNYQISGRTWSANGTEKNLGRWVNRQRDMYQSGKLKKERQEKLERLGLKWPKHAVTWDEMRLLLVDYADQQRRRTGQPWDGQVPVDYQTGGDPPRWLGKWVQKQRSTRAKRKLQKHQEEQLTKMGLQWADETNHDAVVPTMLPPMTTSMTQAKLPQQHPPPTAVVLVASQPDDVDPLQVVSLSMALLGD
jgi:Helicase associated domain